jgi:PBSX family phage terminase large subunit
MNAAGIGLEMSPKQIDFVLNSTARVNVSEGAVRSGKSFGADVRWSEFTQTHQGPFLMTGKTKDTVRRNVVDPLMDLLGTSTVQWINRAEGTLRLGRAICHVIGANDEKAESKVRGPTFGGWYADEITLHPESFVDMALTRLSIPGSKAFWTTNPDSPYHWVHTEWVNHADKKKAGLVRVWHFDLSDNPSLTTEYKTSLAQSFKGLFYARFIEGRWVLAEGAIYDMFSEGEHVYRALPEGIRLDMQVVGIDYGTANPCVFLLIGADSAGGYWVLDEWYWDSKVGQAQKTDEQYRVDLEQFTKKAAVWGYFVDPSAASFITTLRQRGLTVYAADNAVLDGIRDVASFLAAGRLHVHESCTNTIQEFGSYVWDEAAQKRGEDKPLKQHDHCMDALRYGVHTHAYRIGGTSVGNKPAGW